MELDKLDVERSNLIKGISPMPYTKTQEDIYVDIISYDLEEALITIMNGLLAESVGGHKDTAILVTSNSTRFCVELNVGGYPNKNDLLQLMELCTTTLKQTGYAYLLAYEDFSKMYEALKKKIVTGEFQYL